jgi:carboxylesterase type B
MKLFQKLIMFSVIGMLATSSVQAQQQQDSILSALGQEWSAAEVSHAHLAEAIQKLSQAYGLLQRRQADTDAYWAKYVAGLTPEVTGSK